MQKSDSEVLKIKIKPSKKLNTKINSIVERDFVEDLMFDIKYNSCLNNILSFLDILFCQITVKSKVEDEILFNSSANLRLLKLFILQICFQCLLGGTVGIGPLFQGRMGQVLHTCNMKQICDLGRMMISSPSR